MGDVLLNIVYNNKKGKYFRIVNEKDISSYNKTKEVLNSKIQNWQELDFPLPQEQLVASSRYMTPYF